MSKDSVTFWELPQVIVAVSPKSGSTSFARTYPDAQRLLPRENAKTFKEKPCIYYMRNPLSRLVSAYKGFLTVNAGSKHSPPKEVMGDFSRFVEYAIYNRNHHWDPVYPFMAFITEIKPFSEFSELVGKAQENKSDNVSVLINHATFARIAAFWCKDFLIYNTLVRSDTEQGLTTGQTI